jgi:cytochrome c-type biogenesis protein CcmH
MRRLRPLLLAAFAALLAGPALAAEPADNPDDLRQFESERQEARYWELLDQLRCLVCQNQSLASSDADLAKDLRDEVYTQLVEKEKSNEAIIDYLVARYGDFVLYQPPFRPATYLLWLGPFLLLAIGFAVMAVVVRRRRLAASPELSETERSRVNQLLESESDEDKRA